MATCPDHDRAASAPRVRGPGPGQRPGAFADALPGEPVALSTQTANVGSMRVAAKLGFTEVKRVEEYGAEQWFRLWSSATPSG